MKHEHEWQQIKQEDTLGKIVEMVQKEFPYGHPDFARMMIEKIKLFSDKNHDYASGGDTFGNFKRQAAFFAMYPGLDLSDPVVVCAVLMFKQVDAFFWGLSQKIEHKVEGPISRLGDVLVYSGIDICMLKEQDAQRMASAAQAEPRPESKYDGQRQDPRR